MTLFFLIFSLLALGFYSYSIYASLSFFSIPALTQSKYCPPISILKPICGLDRDSYEKLSSFCQQDYPVYQIIFGVRDSEDSAIPVLRKIIADFPHVDIRLAINDRVIGNNLKVSNLANIVPYARYDLLLISDSDIRVGKDYLKHIVQPFQDLQTGVVTCLYRSRAYGLIATLEALSISTDFHAGVLAARQLGWMKFAMGSSILIRKSVLQKIGGFEAIADYLADDFMLGNLPVQAGYRVVLSDYVVEHALDTQTLTDLIQHQTRWNRCTRASNFGGYLGLIFSHGVAMSLLFLLFSQGSVLGWAVLALVWSMRVLMGWVVGVHCLQDEVAAQWLWLIPLRDLLSFGLWCYGLMGDRIVWRGQQFRLGKDGKLLPLNPPSLPQLT
ncbi:MAG: bacteriohopanetetrol glucosamine biosynthesis glycosyltransferase HpnI [Thermosynechococcaceae cyanobacterium]